MRSASDFIRFNIYGRHEDVIDEEVLKSVKIVSTLNGGSKKNISGKTAWPIGGTAGVNNTGSDYIKVSLEEAVTVTDKTSENGVKVFAAAVFGGSRYVDKIIIETDKAIYSKTLDKPHKFTQMNLDKVTVHNIGVNLSGCIRESITASTELVIAPGSPRAALGVTFDDMSGYTLMVDGEQRVPYLNAAGNWCIGEVKNPDAEASIVWEDFSTLPFSQFYDLTTDKVSEYPLYGKMNSDGKLEFSDEFALLDISLNGYTSVNSIKVRTLDGTSLALDGLDFAVLNCIDSDGTSVTMQNNFMMPVLPGTYAGGLEVTVCDNKKLMHRFVADVTSASAGEVRKIETDYTPAVDLVFYEGFDNCVWGSDPSGHYQGYAPDETVASDVLWRTELTGYEDAFIKAADGTAGTGFQLPDKWGSVMKSGHSMTTSYVNSRDFMDWKYLYRTQEFQGCIGVGAKPNFNKRGWVETPALSNLTESSLVKVAFRIMITEGATENFEFEVLNGGAIIGLSIDSVPVLKSGSEIWAETASNIIKANKIATGWHDIVYTVNGATSKTTLRMRGGSTSSSILHGFYLDDITVTKVGVSKIEAEGISELTTLSTIKASFNLSFDENTTEGVTISLPTGGYICGLEIDSEAIADAKYGKTEWPLTESHKISPSEVGTGDHTVTYTIESADAATTFAFTGDAECVSDLKVEKVSSIEQGNFRFLLWNIQNGMWADQGNNYDNFVAWLNKYDPDCFAVIEAETNKKTGSTTSVSSSEKYFTNGWAETAARFGHSYVSNGGNRDGYSQELTSKTPITRIQRITDTDVEGKPVQHGAGHFRITVAGKEIDIVTMHTWPQPYAPGASDEDASEAAGEGDYYREFEIEYVLSKTVLNEKYTSQENWILVGDMNSRSRADNDYYGYAENSTKLIAQDYIRNNTDLVDVIEKLYPGRFLPTNAKSTARIDFIYVSPSLYDFIDSAIVVRDNWTCKQYAGMSNYYYPSDHSPIIVDFNF